MASRAFVQRVDALDPGCAECGLDRAREVEASVSHEPRVEQRGDVLADLVAARPDPRADYRSDSTAERSDRCADDACDEPAPADVHERERRRALEPGERD